MQHLFFCNFSFHGLSLHPLLNCRQVALPSPPRLTLPLVTPSPACYHSATLLYKIFSLLFLRFSPCLLFFLSSLDSVPFLPSLPQAFRKAYTFYTSCFPSRVLPSAPLPSIPFFRYSSLFHPIFIFSSLSGFVFRVPLPLTTVFSSSFLSVFSSTFFSQCLHFRRVSFYRRYAALSCFPSHRP